MKFPSHYSRLRRAIERGLPQGTLGDDLGELGDLVLSSKADADAVCWGLEQIIAGQTPQPVHDTHLLVSLFECIADPESDAIHVFRDRGTPLLLDLFDFIEACGQEDAEFLDSRVDTALLILKILVIYGTPEGTDKVIAVARQPFEPDAYMWGVVMAGFTGGHPEVGRLFSALRQPLPPGFLAISLLGTANLVLLADGDLRHPYDSSEGILRLREWLTSPDPQQFSYAQTATSALPLIQHSGRNELLELASAHPEIPVRIEAAWAAAKLSRQDGFQRLADYAIDVRTAHAARSYLVELGREDVIPEAGQSPDFQALSEFTHWLSHPTELGMPPDHAEICDSRTLQWPPSRELKQLWMVRFTVNDRTGLGTPEIDCGFVGSVTTRHPAHAMSQRPPGDAYAIHCYWEMEAARLIDEASVTDESHAYESLLQQWSGAQLERAQVISVAELAPELRAPQRLVGLATARLEGVDGWVVLDGSSSRWYPRHQQPCCDSDNAVLHLHVGRNLLGFQDEPERSRFLAPPQVPRPPQEIIVAYRKLLNDARQLSQGMLPAAMDLVSPLGEYLSTYADALRQTGRPGEIREALAQLAPYWEHSAGFLALARAALACGQDDLAESFLVRYRDADDEFHHRIELGLLAAQWCRQGRGVEAKGLLLEALIRLDLESQVVEETALAEIETAFQAHRAMWLELFPAEGLTALSLLGIPSSTRR